MAYKFLMAQKDKIVEFIELTKAVSLWKYKKSLLNITTTKRAGWTHHYWLQLPIFFYICSIMLARYVFVIIKSYSTLLAQIVESI